MSFIFARDDLSSNEGPLSGGFSAPNPEGFIDKFTPPPLPLFFSLRRGKLVDVCSLQMISIGSLTPLFTVERITLPFARQGASLGLLRLDSSTLSKGISPLV